MSDELRLLVLFGSLPSYFPQRNGVFDEAKRLLPALAAVCGATVSFHPELVMDGGDTVNALASARAMAADFVLLLRLERSRQMLRSPGEAISTIAAIAHAAGFNDLSYFNRTFRRRYRMTPSDFRNGAQ